MAEAVMGLHGERLMRARSRRNLLWNGYQSWKEDDRIDHLLEYCTRLCGGDRVAGSLLATEAIWA